MTKTFRNVALVLLLLLGVGDLAAAEAAPLHYIRVCKQGGLGVTGVFAFSIYDVDSQTAQTLNVPVGSCVQAATEITGGGEAVVTEAQKVGFSVSSIAVAGGGATAVWTDLTNRSVHVSAFGSPWLATVTFKNVKVMSTGELPTHTIQGPTVKVCKVAGPKVAVGTPYTFSIDGGTSLTVPAGPAPGGYCKVVPGKFGVDEDVTVQEAPVSGIAVTGIAVAPASQLVSADLAGGKAVVHTTPGVVEVTFTNSKGRTGWVEICKALSADVPGSVPVFQFTIPGTSVGTISVPAGACSPAIEVPAGQATITELPKPGYTLLSCATIPASNLIACNAPPGTATVTVSAGGVASETIVSFTNRKVP